MHSEVHFEENLRINTAQPRTRGGGGSGTPLLWVERPIGEIQTLGWVNSRKTLGVRWNPGFKRHL